MTFAVWTSIINMIGQEPTLGDIVLTEQAEAIDLHCYESFPPLEEEQEQRLYRVAVDCAVCKSRLRFVCYSNAEDILKLEDLLFTLGLLCLPCVKANRLNHGG